MDYDLSLWGDRIDHLLEIIADPDDVASLERAQQAISIGNQPDSKDQELVAEMWTTYGEDES